jgi:hypothetical protein
MCVQCVAGAMAAGAATTGVRAWLAVHAAGLLTPRRKRAMTAVLVLAGVFAAGAIGPAP